MLFHAFAHFVTAHIGDGFAVLGDAVSIGFVILNAKCLDVMKIIHFNYNA
jgi:hypothetical protein